MKIIQNKLTKHSDLGSDKVITSSAFFTRVYRSENDEIVLQVKYQCPQEEITSLKNQIESLKESNTLLNNQKIDMLRVIFDTRKIVSECAMEGFNPFKSPVEELFQNNASLSRVLKSYGASYGY